MKNSYILQRYDSSVLHENDPRNALPHKLIVS